MKTRTGQIGLATALSLALLVTVSGIGVTAVSPIPDPSLQRSNLVQVLGWPLQVFAPGLPKYALSDQKGNGLDFIKGALPVWLVGVLFPIVSDQVASVTVSTITTTLIVAGQGGKHIRIGAINLVTAAANNVALLSGTGATCGTGTTGMTGGTTAASGWNFGANGGLAQGNGTGTIMRTTTPGDSVCIITSATTQLSGSISYAIQ